MKVMKDISIALYGQFDNDTKLAFAYSDGKVINGKEHLWTGEIPDPRMARNFNCDIAYAIWRNQYGNYYAIIEPNRADTRNGYIALTVFTAHLKAKEGKEMINLLHSLKQIIIDQNCRKSEDIESLLELLLGSYSQNFIPEAFNAASVGTKKKSMAYRTYDTQAELNNIFTHIDQEEYYIFPWVLIVPRSSVPSAVEMVNSPFERVTTTIKHTYTVLANDPSTTNVSNLSVRDGDTLNITYSRHGFDSVTKAVSISAASPSQYYYIDRNIVRVKSAIEANVVFSRRPMQPIATPLPPVPSLQEITLTVDVDGQQKRGRVSISEKDELYRILGNPVKYQLSARDKRKNWWESGNNIKRLLFLLFYTVAIIGLVKYCNNTNVPDSPPSSGGDVTFVDTLETLMNNNEDNLDKTLTDVEPNLNHDITYLKCSDVWRKDSLQSETYKQLFQFLAEGDYEGVLNHDYSNISNEKSNWFWSYIPEHTNKNGKRVSYQGGVLKHIEKIKGLKDQQKIDDMKDKLKESVQGDTLDLVKLRNDLKNIYNKETGGPTDSNEHTTSSQADQLSQENSDTFTL